MPLSQSTKKVAIRTPKPIVLQDNQDIIIGRLKEEIFDLKENE